MWAIVVGLLIFILLSWILIALIGAIFGNSIANALKQGMAANANVGVSM